MSGRRSHERFIALPSPVGVLRVLSDVLVQTATPEQTVVVSRGPGVLGELVSLQSTEDTSTVPARVLESQLVVMDGNVRHQLRLHQLNQSSREGDDGLSDEAIRE